MQLDLSELASVDAFVQEFTVGRCRLSPSRVAVDTSAKLGDTPSPT
jgi:hypothetical protein